MQIEMIGLYLVIALRMMPVSKDIISQWQAIQSLKGPIEMVENRLDAIRKSEEIDNGTIQFTQIKKSIKFLHVSYCYPLSSVNALEDITIEMPVNSVTALVGPSGSGKSTLIDLLPRLRATTNGTIRIDSTSIGDYSLKSLRQEIAYATQDPQMFDGTIMDHIRYGKPDATKKEVVEAAKLAGADVFIKDLPNKYDTYLGKDAVKISGGQKQRIDLARTIISKPKIMILDEPTSSLDAESENIFRLSIKKIRRETNIAIIIIAHRLASISDSDQIIVLNQGRVESVGKHSDLIRKEGWYSRAWGLQNK
jgi:ABC-type multidrug transport system fused ATPase/permease subunit